MIYALASARVSREVSEHSIKEWKVNLTRRLLVIILLLKLLLPLCHVGDLCALRQPGQFKAVERWLGRCFLLQLAILKLLCSLGNNLQLFYAFIIPNPGKRDRAEDARRQGPLAASGRARQGTIAVLAARPAGQRWVGSMLWYRNILLNSR